MKKWQIAAIVVVVLAVMSSMVFAATAVGKVWRDVLDGPVDPAFAGMQQGHACVDADEDGACDVCRMFLETGEGCAHRSDANGDGRCDACGVRLGNQRSCPGFADADGDGACDACGVIHGGCCGGGARADHGRCAR